MDFILTTNEQSNDTLQFEDYDTEFIALLEMLYGEGLLSQGGEDLIKEMFSEIDLNGLQALDLGCGLGMYDIYLAKHNIVHITAIDPDSSLINRSNENLKRVQNELSGSISFCVMSDSTNLHQFPNDHFDIIFSKESILHVPLKMKEEYFREIYRVLKSNGRIVVMDWMHSSPNYSNNTRKMIDLDKIDFQLQTPPEYHTLLNRVGFKYVEFTDTTSRHAKFSQQTLDTILMMEKKIKDRFGEEMFDYCIESWTYQRDAFATRELLTGIFKTLKE
jgi:phosphoethanolamine N-methyltransferase